MFGKGTLDATPKTPCSRPRPTLISGSTSSVKKSRKLPPETPAKSPFEFQESRKLLLNYLKEVFEIDPLPIGMGHTSEVFVACHRDSAIKYALKVAKAQPEHSRVLRREYELRSKLISPFLVRYEAIVFENGSERDPVAIVEEFASGGTLKVLLDKAISSSIKIPEEKLRSMAKDVLEGLFYLHKNRFLHMDIKPENIFFAEDKRWKIGDFGKMISFDELTGDSGMEGDANYMALELLDEQIIRPVDGSLDMFSFGIVLLEAACQYYPGSDEWRDIRTLGVPPQVLDRAPSEFRSIIKDLLSSRPSARPTAQELINRQYFQVIFQRSIVDPSMDAIASMKLILPPYVPKSKKCISRSKTNSMYPNVTPSSGKKQQIVDHSRLKVEDGALPKKLDFAL